MNDIMFLLLLFIIIHFGLLAKVVDIKPAFSYGKLKEGIYMDCPPCIKDDGRDDCIILGKCIYVLVQAARQYTKKSVEILKKVGHWRQCWWCLYLEKNAKGIVYIALYVHDNLITGNDDVIDEVMNWIKKMSWCWKYWRVCMIICHVESGSQKIKRKHS